MRWPPGSATLVRRSVPTSRLASTVPTLRLAITRGASDGLSFLPNACALASGTPSPSCTARSSGAPSSLRSRPARALRNGSLNAALPGWSNPTDARSLPTWLGTTLSCPATSSQRFTAKAPVRFSVKRLRMMAPAYALSRLRSSGSRSNCSPAEMRKLRAGSVSPLPSASEPSPSASRLNRSSEKLGKGCSGAARACPAAIKNAMAVGNDDRTRCSSCFKQ